MDAAGRNELLTSADAGRLAGLTPASIRRLAKLGELRPAFVTASGQRLFDRSTVEELLAHRRAEAVSK
jgi:DNA-binding transcriptional MerR regulator